MTRPDLSQLLRDFWVSAQYKGAWLYSPWIEILLSYRSTALGPFWILIGTGTFVFAVGSLYKGVVLADATNVYLAHLAVGLVLWFFIVQIIAGSCSLFRKNKANILDGDTNYTHLILKMVTTNFIYLLHNTIVVILVFFYIKLVPPMAAPLILLTLPLVIANLLWMSIILAILGTRYHDFDQFVQAVLRLMFFLTPILWIPHAHVRGTIIDALLYFNPFYYLVEVVRAPLVYGKIPYFEIAVVIAALPIGWLVASILYMRTKSSVALWI